MSKYARLPLQDLKDLQKEFIEFLVVNGVTADQWEKLKVEEKEKAEKILDHFSDVVWESVLRKTDYLIKITENNITSCVFLDNKMDIVSLEVEGVDLRKEDFKKYLTKENCAYADASFSISREEKIFQMLKNGYKIDKGHFYKQALSILK